MKKISQKKYLDDTLNELCAKLNVTKEDMLKQIENNPGTIYYLNRNKMLLALPTGKLNIIDVIK